MKVKDGFLLREVAGKTIVVPVGAELNFSGMITLNETGAFLWRILEKGSDEKGLLDALLSEYDVSEDIAAKDVKTFIDKLTEAGLVK